MRRPILYPANIRVHSLFRLTSYQWDPRNLSTATYLQSKPPDFLETRSRLIPTSIPNVASTLPRPLSRHIDTKLSHHLALQSPQPVMRNALSGMRQRPVHRSNASLISGRECLLTQEAELPGHQRIGTLHAVVRVWGR